MKNTKDEIFAFGVGFRMGEYKEQRQSKKWYVLTFLVGVLGGVVLTLVLR